MLDVSASTQPAYDDLPEAALLERIRAGDARLFEIFVRRNARRVYRAARAILHDEAEIEGVLRDAFLRARAFASGRGATRLSTWPVALAVRDARARVRARGQGTATPRTRRATSELEQAIDDLPDPLRAVCMLCAVEELTVAQAAEVLCISANAVRERLARALELVRGPMERASEVPFQLSAARCDRVVRAALRVMAATATPTSAL